MTKIIKHSDFKIDLEIEGVARLDCWKKQQGDFFIHIFTALHNTSDDIEIACDELRDYIAVFFQSQELELDIERWNIYQLHLVRGYISPDLKQKVEQDKFSTRKLVVEQVPDTLNDEGIIQLIDIEMFEFSIDKRNIPKVDILEFLAQENKQLSVFLSHSVERSKDELIEALKNEFGHD